VVVLEPTLDSRADASRAREASFASEVELAARNLKTVVAAAWQGRRRRRAFRSMRSSAALMLLVRTTTRRRTA
jgi:hypothetical protein